MNIRRRSVVGHRSPRAAILTSLSSRFFHAPRLSAEIPMSSADRDLASQPVSRSQNAVFVLPHDWTSIAEFLAPLVEKIDPDVSDVQLLVVTSDADAAAAVIASSARLIGDRPIRVLAATSAPRASRLAKLRSPHIVSGTPTTVVDLVRGSAIKLADLRAI